MRRSGFKGRRMGFRGHSMGRGMRGFGQPYGRFWGRPYRPFMWWRPFWWYPLWYRPLHWMPWTLMMGGFLYLLYDSMAYKVNSNDAERITRETRKPTKDLSEEELLIVMKRLAIQKLEITPEDQETISTSKQPVKVLSKEEIVTAKKRLGINKLEVVSEGQQVKPQSKIKPINQFCIYCGNALSMDGIFCSRCGKQKSER
jgi:hypothetical protein